MIKVLQFGAKIVKCLETLQYIGNIFSPCG